LLSVVRESFVHFSAPGAGADDVLSAGAQAVAVARPTTASMDTRLETLRMGGIIAHLAMRRQHSDHDDCAPTVRIRRRTRDKPSSAASITTWVSTAALAMQ
jgi:hypothetical protein